jgi:hypothetical protein
MALPQFGCTPDGQVAIQIAEGDFHASGGKGAGRCQADPATTAGHNGHGVAHR